MVKKSPLSNHSFLASIHTYNLLPPVQKQQQQRRHHHTDANLHPGSPMATANKRVPLSCEPCRERKIRCYRNSPVSGRTCDTCLRRGIPLEECIFLRDLPRSQRPIGRRPPRTSNTSEMATSRELFSRIEKLESLLSSSGRTTEDTYSVEAAAASYRHPSASTPSPSMPNTSGQAHRTPPTGIASHRKLSRTASGHERYEPFPSVFPPHLHVGGSSADAATPAPDRQGPRRQFPFTTTTSSQNELLSSLPPLRYCDALKDLYIRVFGSVSRDVLVKMLWYSWS